jgi:hypothetical protein
MDILMRLRPRKRPPLLLLPGAVAAWWLAGCLVDPPQLDDPAVQGEYEDGDAEHRPGQPCLLCHGDGHFPIPPGEIELALGGTVYSYIDDAEDMGLEGVEVVITDAAGLEISASSNRAGNFMLVVNGDVSTPTPRKKGRVDVPRALVYPLGVLIRQGANERRMETKIWRTGSCAHCHGAQPGRDSVGRVYLFDQDVP